ncbi:putative peptidase S8 family protein [Lyophyllum shimeji]|uniref:Peptidase S8 family protein n=1 Tax=Lyophyllum shimeji TaxID=47721 RepID=A0A9P3PW98_LYOSH|nr:putative peptidase S8 family protein [Lyophyllum shimeji]
MLQSVGGRAAILFSPFPPVSQRTSYKFSGYILGTNRRVALLIATASVYGSQRPMAPSHATQDARMKNNMNHSNPLLETVRIERTVLRIEVLVPTERTPPICHVRLGKGRTTLTSTNRTSEQCPLLCGYKAMHFATTVFAAIALALPVIASPPLLHSIQKANGETSGKYIVKLKHGVSKDDIFSQLNVENVTEQWTLINGFASRLSADDLNTLRASPDVEYIAEDGIVRTSFIQYNAPWGLDRISHKSLFFNRNPDTLNHQYRYNPPAGRGVDIYIVGIQITHVELYPRARWGATFGGYPNADGNGHGTHVAGTAAGKTLGVARDASLIAVKVLSDRGFGFYSDIISGLNWVANAVVASRRPSIVNMSIEGPASQALDDTVTALVNKGIHVCVAAGNHNTDAKDTSPARAPGANTVAASTIDDWKASFSNFGAVVNFWAPGQQVLSAWIGPSNRNTAFLNGTSMATPHVTGLIAYFIGHRGNIRPVRMTAYLKSLAVRNPLRGVPAGTVNNMVQNS